jgi:hypothetical protein
MESAIERIVASYVRHNNRLALEQMRMHRQRLAIDLKMRAGYDFSQAIRAIEDDIEVIDAGLERLNKPDG